MYGANRNWVRALNISLHASALQIQTFWFIFCVLNVSFHNKPNVFNVFSDLVKEKRRFYLSNNYTPCAPRLLVGKGVNLTGVSAALRAADGQTVGKQRRKNAEIHNVRAERRITGSESASVRYTVQPCESPVAQRKNAAPLQAPNLSPSHCTRALSANTQLTRAAHTRTDHY